MVTPLIGLGFLAMVFYFALWQRSTGEIGFFNMHAFVVVIGGVVGSLFLAIDRHSLFRMLLSVRDLFPSTSVFSHEHQKNKAGLAEMKSAWREGRRSVVLDMTENAPTQELRVAANALLTHATGHALTERFGEVKADYTERMQPTIEGWDIVSRLAPSFGMVGTVAGMIQLFRNMGSESSNLGGAMAMALLATLYGIAIGAAVGGPMMSRVNNQLNERLGFIDTLEQSVAALLEEDGKQRT